MERHGTCECGEVGRGCSGRRGAVPQHSACLVCVEEVTEVMVKEWSLRFSQVGLVLLGAGPPCQGVSGLMPSVKEHYVMNAVPCSFMYLGYVTF